MDEFNSWKKGQNTFQIQIIQSRSYIQSTILPSPPFPWNMLLSSSGESQAIHLPV